jgi:hypothetical protein
MASPRRGIVRVLAFVWLAAGLFLLLRDDSASRNTPDAAGSSHAVSPADGAEPAPVKRGVLERLKSLGYAEWIPDMGQRRRGVTTRTAAAHPGVNLYTSRPRASAHLIDMDGTVLHTWSQADVPGGWQHVALGPDGSLFAIQEDRALTKLDSHSNIIWQKQLRAHHDIALAADGRVATLGRALRTVDVQGRHLPVMDDRIVIFDPEGTRIDRISIHDLIADAVAAERWQAIEATIAEGKEDVLLQDGSPSDVYHTNSIQFVSWGPEEPRTDALLVSIRELGTLAVIDLTARTVIWRWGRGELESQHHATLQPNGRVLVFDNGRVRERSRVLEIDPLTNTFTELPTGPAFFTETRGGVERCPNGNLLVADSNSGRVFEVTPDGALAWEFWNPDFKGHKRAAVYRMARLPLSTWENLRAAIAVE